MTLGWSKCNSWDRPVLTGGWLAYARPEQNGYERDVTVLRGRRKEVFGGASWCIEQQGCASGGFCEPTRVGKGAKTMSLLERIADRVRSSRSALAGQFSSLAKLRRIAGRNIGPCGAVDSGFGGEVTPDEFDRFRHDSVHALADLNEDCERRYGVSALSRWDYDLDAGTLVFSDAGIPKVVASIQVVGTTSNTSRTWMWAWANTSLPSGVTARVRAVQQFGRAEGLNRLTEPQLADDEHLGWELTAIMVRIMGAKGAYRCPDSNGFMYVVYTALKFADSRVGASPTLLPNEGKVDCDAHGVGQKAFACEHLVLNPKQEWFSDEPNDANPWPDAWCAKCDDLYQERGEWNDENSARLKIKLLCHRCYESLREQQQRA